MKECKNCGKDFVPKKSGKFCSIKCRSKYDYHHKYYQLQKIPSKKDLREQQEEKIKIMKEMGVL